MDNAMLGRIVKKIVNLSDEKMRVIYDLLEKLGSEQGGEWLDMLKKFLRKEKCWVAESILRFVNTLTLTIPPGPFVVRDHFKKDISDQAEVKISYLGDNFKAWFLSLTEQHAGGERSFRVHTLLQDALDKPILDELGALSETSLGEVFALLKKQSKGEEGALLINSRVNIFYVRDVNGELRAVHVYWHGEGWSVFADSVVSSGGWFAECRVYSRNS